MTPHQAGSDGDGKGRLVPFPRRAEDRIRYAHRRMDTAPHNSAFLRAGPDRDALLQTWRQLGQEKLLAPGQLLFLRGEPAMHIWLVVEGRVESVHLSSDGRKFVSFEAHPGDILGEAALIDGATHSACAEASTPARVLFLRGQTVGALLREGGDFATAFAIALTQRLSQTEERAGRVILGDLDSRVANVLLDESAEGTRIVALTHRELGERAGAARESVTEALNRLKRQGIVQLSRRAIRITSVARLAALAKHEGLRMWWPLLKMLPLACASAAMCAALVMGQAPSQI